MQVRRLSKIIKDDGFMTPITNREKANPEIGYPGVGFRCVKSIEN